MHSRNSWFPTLVCLMALTAVGCGNRPSDTGQEVWARPTASPTFRPGPNLGPSWVPATSLVDSLAVSRRQGLAACQNQDYAQAVDDENLAIRDAEVSHITPQAQDYATRAEAEAATEHLAAAWADFRQAIRLDPHQESSYIKFGLWLDRAHQPEQGVAVLTQATDVLPRSAGCWGLRGWLQYKAEQFRPSLISSRRSEILDGSKSYVRYNQGLCYASLGDQPASATAYRRALAQGTDEERQLALMEIRWALREHPRSAALRRSEQMLMDAEKTAGRGTQIQPNALSGGRSLPK
jgi:tetratricopeptide (TPR) repeat protein